MEHVVYCSGLIFVTSQAGEMYVELFLAHISNEIVIVGIGRSLITLFLRFLSWLFFCVA